MLSTVAPYSCFTRTRPLAEPDHQQSLVPPSWDVSLQHVFSPPPVAPGPSRGPRVCLFSLPLSGLVCLVSVRQSTRLSLPLFYPPRSSLLFSPSAFLLFVSSSLSSLFPVCLSFLRILALYLLFSPSVFLTTFLNCFLLFVYVPTVLVSFFFPSVFLLFL